jgi:hypothetical protein
VLDESTDDLANRHPCAVWSIVYSPLPRRWSRDTSRSSAPTERAAYSAALSDYKTCAPPSQRATSAAPPELQDPYPGSPSKDEELRPYEVAARSSSQLLAGTSLTQSRGLPSAFPCLAFPTCVRRPRCFVSVRVSGWMCMPGRSLQRRSMADRRGVQGRLTPLARGGGRVDRQAAAGPCAVFYESGPTGFGLARALTAAGWRCQVAASSKLHARPAIG